MKTEKLKNDIIEKFKKYSNFTRIAGLDRNHFNNNFISKEDVPDKYFKFIETLYNENAFIAVSIDKTKLNKLKKALKSYGGLYKFCKENDGFYYNHCFKIIAGGYYKKVTPVMQKMFDYFEIK